MNLYLIRSNDYDILAEVVKVGLLWVTLKNPVRITESGDQQTMWNYTLYSPFVDTKEIRINRWNILSMTKANSIETQVFYTTVTQFLNKFIAPEYKKTIAKFVDEVETATDNFAKRKEYMQQTDSDVVIVDTPLDRKKMH